MHSFSRVIQSVALTVLLLTGASFTVRDFMAQVSPQPDLIVTAINPPSTVVSGTPSPVSITVQNQGAVDARITQIRLTFGARSIFASTPAIRPGASVVVTDLQTFPNIAGQPAAGSYTYTACANQPISNPMAESNTSNNCLSQGVTVTAGAFPDLEVTGITVSPTSPVPSDVLRFTATIRNAGQRAAPQSFAAYSLLAGLTSTFPVDSNSTYTTRALEPGASTTVEVTKNYGVQLDPGPNRIKICANSVYQHIPEQNETNNCRMVEFIVLGDSTASTDLIVTAINPPSTVVSGTPSPVSITVQNQGAVDARITQIRLTFGARSIFASTPAIRPGASVVVTDLQTFPNIAGQPAAGSYTYTACANQPISNPMAESNTSNNCLSQGVTVTAGAFPDLEVTGITVSPTSPVPSDVLRFTATIRNAGQRAAPQSFAAYSLLAGLTSTFPVDSNSTYTTRALEPGASTTVEVTKNYGVQLDPGPNRIKICANSVYQHIPEQNETNNCRMVEFIVAANSPTSSSAPASSSAASESGGNTSGNGGSTTPSPPPTPTPEPTPEPAPDRGLSQEDIIAAIRANNNNPVCVTDSSWAGNIQSCSGTVHRPEQYGLTPAYDPSKEGMSREQIIEAIKGNGNHAICVSGSGWTGNAQSCSGTLHTPQQYGLTPAYDPSKEGLSREQIIEDIQKNGNHPVCITGTAWNGNVQNCTGTIHTPEQYGLTPAASDAGGSHDEGGADKWAESMMRMQGKTASPFGGVPFPSMNGKEPSPAMHSSAPLSSTDAKKLKKLRKALVLIEKKIAKQEKKIETTQNLLDRTSDAANQKLILVKLDKLEAQLAILEQQQSDLEEQIAQLEE